MACSLYSLIILCVVKPNSFQLAMNYAGRNLTTVPLRAYNSERGDVTAVTEGLDLSNNLIKEVPAYAFSNYTKLRVLYINNNRLAYMSPSAYNETALEKILMHENMLSCIPDLSAIHTNLRAVMIDSNLLYKCVKRVSYEVTFLKLIDLSVQTNKLTHLDTMTILWVSPYLKSVNLQNNLLQQVPNLRPFLPQLKVFDLEYNPMQCSCEIKWLRLIPLVGLSDLKCTTLETNLIMDCICENKWLQQTVFHGFDRTECKLVGPLWGKLSYQELDNCCQAPPTVHTQSLFNFIIQISTLQIYFK